MLIYLTCALFSVRAATECAPRLMPFGKTMTLITTQKYVYLIVGCRFVPISYSHRIFRVFFFCFFFSLIELNNSCDAACLPSPIICTDFSCRSINHDPSLQFLVEEKKIDKILHFYCMRNMFKWIIIIM